MARATFSFGVLLYCMGTGVPPWLVLRYTFVDKSIVVAAEGLGRTNSTAVPHPYGKWLVRRAFVMGCGSPM